MNVRLTSIDNAGWVDCEVAQHAVFCLHVVFQDFLQSLVTGCVVQQQLKVCHDTALAAHTQNNLQSIFIRKYISSLTGFQSLTHPPTHTSVVVQSLLSYTRLSCTSLSMVPHDWPVCCRSVFVDLRQVVLH